jgi:hypothetical protein
MDNQHMAIWQGHTGTHIQAHELISVPIPAAKTRQLSSNRYSPELLPAPLLDITP